MLEAYAGLSGSYCVRALEMMFPRRAGSTALTALAADRARVEGGGRGHIGTSLSLVEILRVLFDGVLRYDAKNPKWPGRDRFILSKGHGCITLYVLLQEKGFFPEAELGKFCRFDGILGGHPDPKVPGIEVSTGSLGHGLPIAVGMAVAAKRRVDKHRVVVVSATANERSIGCGRRDERAKHREQLVRRLDDNKHQSTQHLSVISSFADRECLRLRTREVDVHDGRPGEDVTAIPSRPANPQPYLHREEGTFFA